jgi:hypothetical protein
MPGSDLQGLVGQKLLLTGSGAYGGLKDTALGAEVQGLAQQALQQQHARFYQLDGDFGAAGIFIEGTSPGRS